jgi:hypothetical protein
MEVKKSSLGFLAFCLIICILSLLAVSAVEPLALADGPAVLWEKTFGGSHYDYGDSVQQTTDGGFIIVGYSNSFDAGSMNVYLIKADLSGNLLWQKTFGGSGIDRGYSVQETTDGGFIIGSITYDLGYPYSDRNNNFCLIKTDPNGTLLWQKTFGGEYGDDGCSVQQTTDGGFIIAGTTYLFGADDVRVYLIKTDTNGTLLWKKTFGGSGWDVGCSVQQTSDGGYIIAGNTDSFGAGGDDVYLIKTDSAGTLTWQKTFGGIHNDYGESVQQTTDGGYIIAGSTISFGAGSWDVYLVKTDSIGNLLWQKTFGGSGWDVGPSVQQTTDGGYIIGGETTSFGADQFDAYLIKTDPNGNLLWQKTLGIDGWWGGWIRETTNGGFIITGTVYSSGAGHTDVYLIKLCSENTSLGDLNCDSCVDFDDLSILINQWLKQPDIPSADIAPNIRDNLVDFRDLAKLAEYWLEGATP